MPSCTSLIALPSREPAAALDDSEFALGQSGEKEEAEGTGGTERPAPERFFTAEAGEVLGGGLARGDVKGSAEGEGQDDGEAMSD